jgi:ADP-ribose pyrophosphatase YjhB (NUDIX family)
MSNYPTEFAKHFIGVGGIVIHNDKALLVKLNYGRAQKYWLIPGGFVNPGETLIEGVEREVFEETGMRVEAQGILGVRTMVRHRDNLTDLYSVLKCVLKSVPEPLVPQASEIKAVTWMPISETMTNPEVLDYSRIIIKKALENKYLQLDKPLNEERKKRLDLSKYEQFWV